ncbi:DUF805 domain-containing protein [Zemynaea arenosa]|nr:DUF805 domain-containing protein [Massilia arenosa]
MTNPYAAPDLSVADTPSVPAGPGHTNVFALNGRLGRIRYFTYVTLAVAATFGVAIVVAVVMVFLRVPQSIALQVSTLVPLAVTVLGAIAGLVFARRRLQDLDTTPWILLLFLVPLVNLGLMLRLLFGKGTPAHNRFGPPPPPNGRREYILFACALLIMVAVLSAPFLAAGINERG